MFDPSDYQNTNGVNSGVTNYMNGTGSQGAGAASVGGSWLKQAGNWLGSDSMSQGMGGIGGGMNNGQMILAADQMGGQLFGLLAGQNETTVGNVMKNIPGLSTVGNLINAAFGSHINDEFVAQTQYGTNAINSQIFRSNTNADVLNDWRNSFQMAHVRKSEVGSDGWFSNKAKNKTNELNNAIDEANMKQLINLGIAAGNADQNTDLRILQGMAAYGGPINSFRKYYDKGGYLSQAKALIRQNEGWREKPYADAPKGKNWRSVGYGFNDSGFREKYPEGISKHYEHGITKKQAEEELDYFLSKAEKQLKSIYGKQWNDFTDSQKAAILDTYYQRPASVGKGSRFYKAVTAGEDAGRYLGVAGFDKRNKIRQGVFGGSQDYVNLGAETENPSANSSSLQEVTPFTPVVRDLDLSGITPTQVKAPQISLNSPTFDLSMFGSTPTQQESYVPTVGTVEDFLASYGDFDDMLFAQGGFLGRRYEGEGNLPNYLERPKNYIEQFSFSNEPIYGGSVGEIVVTGRRKQKPQEKSAFEKAMEETSVPEFTNTFPIEQEAIQTPLAAKGMPTGRYYAPLSMDNNLKDNEYLNSSQFIEDTKNKLASMSKDEVMQLQTSLARRGYYDLNSDNMTEKEIKALQTKLYNKGLLKGDKSKEIDGKIGPKTKEAYRKYMTDGIVGSKTTEAYLKSISPARRWSEDVSTDNTEWCAQWVTKKVRNASGEAFGVTGDAWRMPNNIVKAGGEMLYNIYDDNTFNNVKSTDDLKSKTVKAINNNPFDISQLQVGDVVGIYMPSSDMHETALNNGTTYNTHVGVVTGFNKDGVPIIEHNIHKNHHRDRADHLTGSKEGSPRIATVTRPAYSTPNVSTLPIEEGVSPYVQEGDHPLFKEYADGVAGAKSVIGKMFPNANMDAVEQAVLAVQGRETNFMRTKGSDLTGVSKLKYKAREFYRDKIKETDPEAVSSDLNKMKLSSFTPNERHLLGIKKPSDLNNPELAGRAATYMMAKNYDYFKRLSIEYPELGLTEDDLRYLTELSYNQGMDKLKTIGFDEKGNIKKSEIEAIREMAKPDAKVKDISSTNYRHLGAVGKFLYDKFGSAHTPYISAAEKYRSQLLSRLQANPEGMVAQAKSFGGNLFDNGGWLDFFQAWNQAKGGNNYFSQGNGNWKPSDGLQKNISNGNVADWMGVAGQTVNTIANWGKEDPSLGRGGGYSQFGMAAFDIAKTIRNATKSKRESIDQKLGIPIYARGGRLFADGGSTGGGEGVGAMGYAQIGTAALKLASNAVHQASLDDDIDEKAIHRSINRFGRDFDDAVANVNTNGDLLDLWQNNSTIAPNLNTRDFRDKSYFDDFLDSYAASWEGFNAGQNFGPWGAAIGAIVGGGSSVIGSIIGRNKASNAADEANRKIEEANERRIGNLLAAAERVDEENDLRILQNMGANGGKLSMGFGLKNPFVMPDGTANPLYKAFGGGLTHGMDWDTGINWVDEGGSHGENPLGGVPMGVDEQGIPNLVEEGEAIWNGDYVFSKRMKVPKKLREKYSLPDDATFADAVAKLTKNSDERPLSSIDRNTQDYILGEFADTQEEMRTTKAQRAMDKQQQLQDDFLMGMQFGLGGHMSPIGIVPDSDNVSLFDKLENSFADGGGIHIDPSKKGTFKAQASKMGMGVQEAASHILAHKENYSPAMVKKANFAKNFAHAFGGSLFDNPFGEANTFDFGGDLKTRRNTIMRNSGVTEEQANAMLFRMLSKEDRGRAIKERVFGTWTPTYNSNMEIVVPTAITSNRGNVNRGISQSVGNPKTASQKSGGKPKATSSVTTKPKGVTGLNLYDWYRNGSDGISEPTGFKVGQNGKAYDYTQEYRDLVNSLGADDIRKWAAEHPDDPSLKSFLAKGNDLSKLTDDQWRTGATDGKYGFMHHVADSMLGGTDESEEMTEPAATRAAEDPEWAVNFGDHEVMRNIEAGLNPDGTTPAGNTGTTRSGFKPKQTWTRNLPWMMSGIMGFKEMLTPADYGNANMILDAAYGAGQPISVGTEYIGDYRKRDPFDERYLMNIINQRGAATNRNFMNLSGGNRAVAMSGILANDLTTQMSLAEAARQAYLANRADDAQVAEFNRGTNIFNAQAQNTRNLSLAQLNSQRQNAMLSGIAQGARLRQAIKDQRDAAISANLSAFAQGLGDLGKENGYYNMLGGLNDEGVLNYFYGDNWRTMFNK